MRILVATTPGWGHVSPVLPYAEELRRRGHTLTWATASDAATRLADDGFDVVACGLPLRERLPLAAGMLADRAQGVPPDRMRAHAFTVHFAVLGATRTYDALVDAVSRFHPDVIVREPCELGAALVAHRDAIPIATVGFGGVVPATARHAADEVLATQFASTGTELDSDEVHFGDLYLHPMPASLDRGDVPTRLRRVRPAAAPVPSGADPLGQLGLEGFGRGRGAVYATFGTEFGAAAPWSAVLEAFGEMDIDVVASTGTAGLPDGSGVPPNVTVVEYVDQRHVFERVAVVLSHGGAGTLLGAASAGLPQVCIPLGADQFENAAAAADRGIGVVVGPSERRAAPIARALRRALTEPEVAAAARQVSAEIATAADVRTATDWIEGLAGAGTASS